MTVFQDASGYVSIYPVDPMPAAIANAVADAVGVRLREVPLTAARVKAAIGV